ncbi:MAG: TerD family protein [Cytophagales bacterium]
MAINLKKGGSFNLTKELPTLNKILIGLGWEMTSQTIDLDASAFVVGANGKLLSDEYFVFYNNLKSPDGAIQHTGDNRTGSEEDDDEIILANLALINPNATEVVVVVSIHEAISRRHTFGLLKDAYIRLYDVEKKQEILRYDLDASHTNDNTAIFGKIRKVNGEWHFYANSEGNSTGLQGVVDIYA